MKRTFRFEGYEIDAVGEALHKYHELWRACNDGEIEVKRFEFNEHNMGSHVIVEVGDDNLRITLDPETAPKE